jgi:hypothetical protein
MIIRCFVSHQLYARLSRVTLYSSTTFLAWYLQVQETHEFGWSLNTTSLWSNFFIHRKIIYKKNGSMYNVSFKNEIFIHFLIRLWYNREKKNILIQQVSWHICNWRTKFGLSILQKTKRTVITNTSLKIKMVIWLTYI